MVSSLRHQLTVLDIIVVLEWLEGSISDDFTGGITPMRFSTLV